jgi:hypothetical protein
LKCRPLNDAIVFVVIGAAILMLVEVDEGRGAASKPTRRLRKAGNRGDDGIEDGARARPLYRNVGPLNDANVFSVSSSLTPFLRL